MGVEINVIFKPIDQGFYKGLSHGEFLKALDKGVDFLRKSSHRPRPSIHERV